MANIRFENGVKECLKNFEAPIANGPIPRWQRKEQKRFRQTNGPLSPLPNNFAESRRPSEGIPKASKPKASKTPKKSTPGKRKQDSSPSRGDRFIPCRPSSNDCDWSHYQVLQGSSQGEAVEEEGEEGENSELMYQKKLSSALNDGKPESKILHFKSGAPVAKEGYQNDLRVLYCQSKPSGPKAKSTRHIPQVPDRILDAPDMLDDYYLNLLDWGANNLLGLALGGGVYVWNASTSDIKHLFQMDDGEYVSSVAWVREPSMPHYLAVGTHNGQAQLWDVEACKCVRVMGGHAARVGALSWNSFLLSSGSRSGAIHHHDVRVANHHIGTLLNHTQEVCGLSWSLDGKLLASGGNDNVVNIWPYPRSVAASDGPGDVPPLFSLTHHQAAVKALSWCPWQQNVLATGGGTADRHIRFWNASTGTFLNSLDTKSQVCSILWSKEYKEIISGHGFSQNQLTIWKYPSMARVADLTGHTSRVLCMAMSPDGQYVASAAADETLRLWKCFGYQPKQKKTHRGGEGESSNRLMSSMKVR